MSDRSKPVRGGYTLTELVIGMLAFSLLMVGLLSSILIATRASDPDLGPPANAVDAGMTAGEITTELQCLLSVIDRSDKSIEFTVPDRNNDSTPETIRYEWSGTLGDPLTRQYNGGTVHVVADDVHAFNLDYWGPSALQLNLLSNPDFETGATAWIVSGGDYEVSADVAFRGAASLKVTNRSSSSSGPSQQVEDVIENAETYEAEVWMKTISGSADFHLVLTTTNTSNQTLSLTGASTPVGTFWTSVTASLTPSWGGTLASATLKLESNDGGATDFYVDTASLRDVNGTNRIYLHRIAVSLQIGSDQASRADKPVEILNTPVVPAS